MNFGCNCRRPLLYYDDISPQARSCYVLIKMLKLDIELCPISLINGEHMTAEYNSINPSGTVPTLIDGRVTLCDGHTIMIYLCDKYMCAYQAKLCPQRYITRMLLLNLLFYEGCVLYRRHSQLVTAIVMDKYPNVDMVYHQNKIADCYNTLNSFLIGHCFMVGNCITIADLSMVSTVGALNLIFPINRLLWPNLYTWFMCLKSMPWYIYNAQGIEKQRQLLANVGEFSFPTTHFINDILPRQNSLQTKPNSTVPDNYFDRGTKEKNVRSTLVDPLQSDTSKNIEPQLAPLDITKPHLSKLIKKTSEDNNIDDVDYNGKVEKIHHTSTYPAANDDKLNKKNATNTVVKGNIDRTQDMTSKSKAIVDMKSKISMQENVSENVLGDPNIQAITEIQKEPETEDAEADEEGDDGDEGGEGEEGDAGDTGDAGDGGEEADEDAYEEYDVEGSKFSSKYSIRGTPITVNEEVEPFNLNESDTLDKTSINEKLEEFSHVGVSNSFGTKGSSPPPKDIPFIESKENRNQLEEVISEVKEIQDDANIDNHNINMGINEDKDDDKEKDKVKNLSIPSRIQDMSCPCLHDVKQSVNEIKYYLRKQSENCRGGNICDNCWQENTRTKLFPKNSPYFQIKCTLSPSGCTLNRYGEVIKQLKEELCTNIDNNGTNNIEYHDNENRRDPNAVNEIDYNKSGKSTQRIAVYSANEANPYEENNVRICNCKKVAFCPCVINKNSMSKMKCCTDNSSINNNEYCCNNTVNPKVRADIKLYLCDDNEINDYNNNYYHCECHKADCTCLKSNIGNCANHCLSCMYWALNTTVNTLAEPGVINAISKVNTNNPEAIYFSQNNQNNNDLMIGNNTGLPQNSNINNTGSKDQLLNIDATTEDNALNRLVADTHAKSKVQSTSINERIIKTLKEDVSPRVYENLNGKDSHKPNESKTTISVRNLVQKFQKDNIKTLVLFDKTKPTPSDRYTKIFKEKQDVVPRDDSVEVDNKVVDNKDNKVTKDPLTVQNNLKGISRIPKLINKSRSTSENRKGTRTNRITLVALESATTKPPEKNLKKNSPIKRTLFPKNKTNQKSNNVTGKIFQNGTCKNKSNVTTGNTIKTSKPALGKGAKCGNRVHNEKNECSSILKRSAGGENVRSGTFNIIHRSRTTTTSGIKNVKKCLIPKISMNSVSPPNQCNTIKVEKLSEKPSPIVPHTKKFADCKSVCRKPTVTLIPLSLHTEIPVNLMVQTDKSKRSIVFAKPETSAYPSNISHRKIRDNKSDKFNRNVKLNPNERVSSVLSNNIRELKAISTDGKEAAASIRRKREHNNSAKKDNVQYNRLKAGNSPKRLDKYDDKNEIHVIFQKSMNEPRRFGGLKGRSTEHVADINRCNSKNQPMNSDKYRTIQKCDISRKSSPNNIENTVINTEAQRSFNCKPFSSDHNVIEPINNNNNNNECQKCFLKSLFWYNTSDQLLKLNSKNDVYKVYASNMENMKKENEMKIKCAECLNAAASTQ